MSTKDDAFFHLKFESLAGLHPVSFENDLYVASKCRRTTGGTYGGFSPVTALPPDPINAKVGIACGFDYLAAFSDPPEKWTTPKKLSSSLESCCFVALAAPSDGNCKSAGTQGSYQYSDEFAYTDEAETSGNLCHPGGIRHVGPDTHTKRIKYKESVACRRRVEGVALKACFITDAYGQRKLELTAIVTYKDHVAYVSDYWYDYKIDYAARAEDWISPGGVCFSLGSMAARTVQVCGTDVAHSYSTDASIPDRAVDCICVPTSTSGTCTTETIVRKVLLDPDCTIKGTHVFQSGLPATTKIRVGCYCFGSSILGSCYWPYATVNCPLSPPEFRAFETAFSITFPNSWHTRVINTTSNPSTAVTCTSQPTLMNWWTEDWTITIT